MNQCANTQHMAWLIVRTEAGKSMAYGDTDEGQQLTTRLWASRRASQRN